MKTLILGIGNPFMCDDGIGLHIANALEGMIPDVSVTTTTMIDLQLLEILADYDMLFVIDALISNDDKIGTIKKISRDSPSLHLYSSHGLHFFELLKLGQELKYKIPEIGGIYGIVIRDNCSFGTKVSPEILVKQKDIIVKVAEDIKKNGIEHHVSRDSM
ncbi:hydrogenase maturation protease [Thermodesulfobacteriota bacterium]